MLNITFDACVKFSSLFVLGYFNSRKVASGFELRRISFCRLYGIPPFECEAVVGDDGHRRAVVERQKTRVKGRGRPCLDLADGGNTFQSSGRIVASLPIGIDRQQVVEIPRESLGVAVSVRVAHCNFVDQTGVGSRIYRSCDITYRNLVEARRIVERYGYGRGYHLPVCGESSDLPLHEPYLRGKGSRLLPIGNGDREPLPGVVNAAIRRASEVGIGQVVGDFHLERVDARIYLIIPLDANIERLYRVAPHIEVRGVVLAQIDVVGHLQPVLLCFDAHIGRTLRSVLCTLLLLGRDGRHVALTIFQQIKHSCR